MIPAPPAFSSLRTAIASHARSVHALVLRDIKTRMGASYFGFLFGLLIPLAHVGILLTIYHVLGRRAPIGTDVTIFLTTAVLPFVIWSYTHQKMALAFSHNRALLAFPVITIIDIMIARSLVEAVNSTLVVIVVCTFLSVFGFDLFIYSSHIALFCLILSYILGVSTGIVVGLISMIYPIALMIGFLIMPIYWITSGVFFIPDALPAQLRDILGWFPLANIVDYGRTGFYSQYVSDWGSVYYVFGVIVTNIFIVLVANRALRALLTAK